MKIVMFLLSILNNTYAQGKLTRIKQSNFFTNQTDVFYVTSNKLNSSGLLGELMTGIDTLLIANKAGNKFDNTVKVISKEFFLSTFDLKKQYFQSLTIAIKIPEIDFKNFEPITKNYAKSNKLVLHTFNVIKNADYNSFEIRNDIPIDKNYVFFNDQVIEKANPKTFQYLNNLHSFSKDDLYVFHNGKILEKADPKSFRILSYTYQKDNNHVWVIGKQTPINAKSFKVLEYSYPEYSETYKSLYSVDKNHVYFQGEVLTKAHVASFKLIVSGAPYQIYGIDKNHVFYNEKILEYADIKTFKVIKNKNSNQNYDAEDRNYKYTRDKKTKTK